MIQSTSLLAYREIQPTLNGRQKEVFDLLSSGPMTNKEMAVRLGYDACSVTGRTNELVKAGLVMLYERRRCKVSGRCAISWCVVRDTLF